MGFLCPYTVQLITHNETTANRRGCYAQPVPALRIKEYFWHRSLPPCLEPSDPAAGSMHMFLWQYAKVCRELRHGFDIFSSALGFQRRSLPSSLLRERLDILQGSLPPVTSRSAVSSFVKVAQNPDFAGPGAGPSSSFRLQENELIPFAGERRRHLRRESWDSIRVRPSGAVAMLSLYSSSHRPRHLSI